MRAPGTPTFCKFAGVTLPVHSVNTLIIGSGAAGRNAALQLVRHGQPDVAMVTERWNAGTSYNAGSDKQTYYKLSLAGAAEDSPRQLAADLYSGGCMHGDIALCEAHHSAQAFYNLVGLGVPFPHERYGGYVGYRTDNDQRGRATSAGPLTSKLMCECLGRALEREPVRLFDHHQVIALLVTDTSSGGSAATDRAVCGAIALDKEALDDATYGLTVFSARNVVLATGGPGALYRDSVYPQSQLGSTGMALRAGAMAHNLTEWQFGLASVGFRWNVSGSYQQVMPRYISTEPDGSGEREFLCDHFPDLHTLSTAIFRKGYEWPFDCERIVDHGSSLIDLLVHREIVGRGRRVFLDYTRNPSDPAGSDAFSVTRLDPDVRRYLDNCGALQDTPIERLSAMNSPAVDLFRNHGTDLAHDRLEIAVCAQHNNGGLRANIWWESNVRHLFPIGEVCGTHGVRRPGGAALNAGQVGAIRAASYIAHNYSERPPSADDFALAASDQVAQCLAFCSQACGGDTSDDGTVRPASALAEIQERMSAAAGHVREPRVVAAAVTDAWRLQQRLDRNLRVPGPKGLPLAFRVVDLCLTHAVYLEAIAAYLSAGGRSRGGALVLDPAGTPCGAGLGERWCYARNPEQSAVDRQVLELCYEAPGRVRTEWVDVRPIPSVESWFEEAWAEYRSGEVFSLREEG
ncbi:MAG: FAD-binding protein [Gemmatimonadota bacterium]|nr:MAG: FAD-binding protein [Gemmatimonadota bacterium]